MSEDIILKIFHSLIKVFNYYETLDFYNNYKIFQNELIEYFINNNKNNLNLKLNKNLERSIIIFKKYIEKILEKCNNLSCDYMNLNMDLEFLKIDLKKFIINIENIIFNLKSNNLINNNCNQIINKYVNLDSIIVEKIFLPLKNIA